MDKLKFKIVGIMSSVYEAATYINENNISKNLFLLDDIINAIESCEKYIQSIRINKPIDEFEILCKKLSSEIIILKENNDINNFSEIVHWVEECYSFVINNLKEEKNQYAQSNNLDNHDSKIVIVNTDNLESPKAGADIYENRSNVINQNKSESLPEVTIAVQGYNRIEKTKQCVEALLRYTKNVNYQLVLIDNGSSDETFEYFKSINHNRKTIIRITKNVGAQFTGKYIRQYTQGKYLCVLANDIIVTKNWLSNLLVCIKSDKRIGWAIPSSSNTSNYQDPGLQFASIDEMQMKAAKYNVSNPNKWHELVRNVAATALVRIELYDIVGMGDYGFLHEFGDDDLSFRTRRAGYKMILCKDTFVHHNHDVFNYEGKDIVQVQKSIEKGKLDFKNKYFGIDAWDDTINFEQSMINMVEPLGNDDIQVLGIDVKCGTPILQVKNNLRENGVFDVTLSSLFSDAKYWLDLKLICEGDVVCDRIEYLLEHFKFNKFDYILVGEPVNSYKDMCKFIFELISLIKPGGQALVKLDNTFDMRSFFGILGKVNSFDFIYPSHISIDEMQKMIINSGGKITNISAELHIVDEQTKSYILDAIKNTKIVSDVDEVFNRMLVKNYVISISK